MKLGAIALDYDGTITNGDLVEPAVREAIAEARSRGIAVLIVTGRRLEHLRADTGGLDFVNAVVAENGGVIAFPATGRSSVIAPLIPPAFVEALQRRGLEHKAGECLVEADAAIASSLLEVIRDLELPLVLLFNRGRVMVLPQGISKATGLRYALSALRISPHNCVSIGNAENDHELLAAAEIGLAVGWGSPALRAMADGVVEGNDATAVAATIRSLAGQRRLEPAPSLRRRLLIGQEIPTEKTLWLPLRGRNVLIVGDPRSGKSWIAGLLAEQMILQGYSVCVIDPEGEYNGLDVLPGVLLFGGDDPPPHPRELIRALRHGDVSAVIDLSRLQQDRKRKSVAEILNAVAILRRETGLPHRVVIDEAHYFLSHPERAEVVDVEQGGYVLVTYRASELEPKIRSSAEAVVVTRETDPREAKLLQSLCGCMPASAESLLADLDRDAGVLLLPGQADGPGFHHFRIAPRMTYHVRHQHKYLDVPIGEDRAFVFVGGQRARSLNEFAEIVAHSAVPGIAAHLRNHDFSRWIASVFADHALARIVREQEDAYRLSLLPDVNDAIISAIRERYLRDGESEKTVTRNQEE